jgi:pimeloyl-ACP methyl ester carboxylesterase
MARVPGATLVTIADAGHMLHHDQPQAVAAAIERFLS